jgi:hypothetical protein
MDCANPDCCQMSDGYIAELAASLWCAIKMIDGPSIRQTANENRGWLTAFDADGTKYVVFRSHLRRGREPTI